MAELVRRALAEVTTVPLLVFVKATYRARWLTQCFLSSSIEAVVAYFQLCHHKECQRYVATLKCQKCQTARP